MKTISIHYAESHMKAVLNSAQKEQIVVTRGGKPSVVIVGVESYDEEDLQLATSPEFWRMIEKRRLEPSIPLSELKLRLRSKANGRQGKKEERGRRRKGASDAPGV